jgi:glucose/arabinose dehydrogenase
MIRLVCARVTRRAAAATLALCAACSDQTAPAIPAAPGLALVTSALSRPVFVTAPAGDTARLFVVEQGGTIRVIRHDTLLATPFLDIGSRVACCGERGLLGLAFDPAYAANGRFYVDYTDTAGTTQVVRFTVSGDPDVADPGSASPVLSQAQPYPNHNGGMLAFGPDGFLYVGLGDGGSAGDPSGNGQNLTVLLGKILRLDVSGASGYAIPATNPFAGQPGARGEIWAYGLRNPWRFSFDRTTGELYIADVGQSASEEVDIEAPGSGGNNYGWNLMEGAACYRPGCSPLGLVLPVLTYDHGQGCSITGGYVYRGTRIPALTGTYLYADYCAGWVRSFRWTGGAAVAQQDEPDLVPGGTITSFGEDARGELYITTYTAPGSLYRIVPVTP